MRLFSPHSVRSSLAKVTKYPLSLDPALRTALGIFVLVRLGLSVFAVAVMWRASPYDKIESLRYLYHGLQPVAEGIPGILLGVWQRWDTLWYQKIATVGYSVADGSTAFYPLYPLLVHLLGRLLFENYLLAALVVSNAACLGSFYVLFKLTQMDFDQGVAARAVLYLAIAPGGIFLFSGYTESTLLLLILLSFYLARRNNWLLAGIFGCLAALTKAFGVMLIVPLAIEYIMQRSSNYAGRGPRPSRRSGVYLLLIPAGTLGYLVYRVKVLAESLSAEGSVRPVILRLLVPSAQERFWEDRFVLPWDNVALALKQVVIEPSVYTIAPLAIGLLYLLVILLCWRRLPLSYGIFGLVMIVAALSFNLLANPLARVPRHLLVAFPVFVALGSLCRDGLSRRLVVYLSSGLLLMYAATFVIWSYAG